MWGVYGGLEVIAEGEGRKELTAGDTLISGGDYYDRSIPPPLAGQEAVVFVDQIMARFMRWEGYRSSVWQWRGWGAHRRLVHAVIVL